MTQLPTHPLAEAADTVAEWAHAEQRDQAGEDYIAHPRRVAARVAARLGGEHDAVVVALLHDVLEDTEVIEEELQVRFGRRITAAVVAVSRRRGEQPEDYYARVAADPLALAVKEADLEDNTDPERMARLAPGTRERLERKYAQARHALGL